MRLDRAARIGNWSALEVRQMLRRFGADVRDLRSVTAGLGLPGGEARRVLTRLLRDGYVERDPDRLDAVCWRRTRAGKAFAEGSFGRPVSRAQAERLLQGVLRRVAEVNRRPHYLCRVTAVGVFGSYVTGAPVLDELDLAVHIAPKPPAPGTADELFRPDRRLPYWRLQKLLPSRDWPRWRERHVELYLEAGKPSIVLHGFDDPLLRGKRVRLVFVDGPGPPPPVTRDPGRAA